MKYRLQEMDYLRGFAALSVIAIHVTSGYTANGRSGFVLNQIVRYAVPMFIILSGFVTYYADAGRGRFSCVGFLRRRLGKVLWPYVFWTAFYVLYASRQLYQAVGWGAVLQSDRLLALGSHLLFGTGYYHLYFLLIVFQLYLLYPCLRILLQKKPVPFLISTFILTLLSQTGIYLHQINIIVLPDIGMPYVSLFPLWIFYFVFGMYLASVKELNNLLYGKEVFWVTAWLGSLLILLVDSRWTNTGDSSIKPSMMLYSLVAYFFFYLLALRFKKMRKGIESIGESGKIKKNMGLEGIVNWLSAQSFLIFLFHPLVLDQLLLLHENTGLPILWQGKVGMVGLFLATTVITFIFTYIACFIPWVQVVGGVYMKKRRVV